MTTLTEMRQMFEIAENLVAARQAAAKAADDIAFYLNEFAALRDFSDNDRLRAVYACIAPAPIIAEKDQEIE